MDETPSVAAATGADSANRARARRGWFILGASGWAFAVVVWIVGWRSGVFHLSGDVADLFLPAGRAFWSGGSPYDRSITPAGIPFLYAPPWAALFGIVAPLGPTLIHAALSTLELLALRYVAGSWIRAGVLCWFLLVPWELADGQLNLLAAAAIVAAVMGRPEGAAVMGLAKGSPVLGVGLRDWRRFLAAAIAFSALSLPRLDLWPAWVSQLASVLGDQPGPLVPIPWAIRLPIGIGLVVWGRPWSRALGAAVATPGL